MINEAPVKSSPVSGPRRDFMADGTAPGSGRSRCGIEQGDVVAGHLDRGLPGRAEPQEQPAQGGEPVLIHHVNPKLHDSDPLRIDTPKVNHIWEPSHQAPSETRRDLHPPLGCCGERENLALPAKGHNGQGAATATEPMCRSTLQRAFRLALKSSGVKKAAHVHTLRHSLIRSPPGSLTPSGLLPSVEFLARLPPLKSPPIC
jgi:hypothetical protein